jgi:hypothetical protein
MKLSARNILKGNCAVLTATVLWLLATAAHAGEAPACAEFKWPLAVERSWFEAANSKELHSGAEVDEVVDGAFRMALKPTTKVAFVMLPGGKQKPDKPLGAVLTFGAVPMPGTYQVTLSEEAWIDVVQGFAYRPSIEFSDVNGCPGLRKSVRFEFESAPLTLQLSSASAPSLKVAIKRVK